VRRSVVGSKRVSVRIRQVSVAVATVALIAGVAVAGGESAQAQTSASGKALGPVLPPPTAATTPAPKTARTAPSPQAKPRATPKRAAAKRVASKNTRARSKSASTGAAKKPKRSSNAGGFGQGASGDQVLALQTRLAELHYDITNPDGKFGNQTWHAVLAFQKANNLGRTARVNAKMLDLLETATDPTPAVPEGGADRIEVDLKRQYLTLYRGGQLEKIVSISSGTGKPYCAIDPETKKNECDVAKTPTGSFRVQSRIAGFRESKLGLLYNPLYFNGGFAIHGSNSVPGYPASHGCVRIPNSTSEWFVTDVPDRIPVYVVDGTFTPKPLSGTANPLPQTGGGTSTIAPTTALPTTTSTTTIPGIARILTTAPAGVTTVPAATTTPTATTLPASIPTVLVTPPVGGSTSTIPVTTVPGATTVPASTSTTPTTTIAAATTTTSATIPIAR
jgi:peptidoglycan hydrolase-like protein with peptidoglycan-binding domain